MIRDQAESLRLKMQQSQRKPARSIAIVSGKGGVGKSNFSTNFAYALREAKKSVLIIDMDIGMGNIHILLGMTPGNSLKDYLNGTCSLPDVINNAPEGLDFIAGGSGLDSVMEWTEEQFTRLMQAFEALQYEYDFLLFDMGAGASNQTIDFLLAVEEIIVITTTEPTSITDAYSMMKFICLRDLNKAIHLVSNRVTKEESGTEAIMRLQFAMKRFLNKETKILGFLPDDPAVHKAVVAQKPFLKLFPSSQISKKMTGIAASFLEPGDLPSEESKDRFIHRLKSMFLRGRG